MTPEAIKQLKISISHNKECERQIDDLTARVVDLTEYYHQLIAKIEVMKIKLIEREDGLHKLMDAADDSDGCQYGTLSTTFVRDICKVALELKP
jgi:hypothetical protein